MNISRVGVDRIDRLADYRRAQAAAQTFRGTKLEGVAPIDSNAEITLKYKWRKSWDDKENDFVGFDPDHLDQFGKPVCIGRFYLGHVAGGKDWQWFGQWRPDWVNAAMPTGRAESARHAAQSIERAYDHLRAMPPPPRR